MGAQKLDPLHEKKKIEALRERLNQMIMKDVKIQKKAALILEQSSRVVMPNDRPDLQIWKETHEDDAADDAKEDQDCLTLITGEEACSTINLTQFFLPSLPSTFIAVQETSTEEPRSTLLPRSRQKMPGR